MEKEHLTGKVDELKGKAKQGIGSATDNPGLETEGVLDELKGNIKQGYADLKDSIKGADHAAGSTVNKK